MTVWALGINHHSAPLSLRERFAVAVDQIQPRLQVLRQRLSASNPVAAEAALLSTCNRTELYCTGDSGQAEQALTWLAQSAQLEPNVIRPHLYQWQGPQAARHVFRVAAGLDSMVLGEPQILGQLKDAVRVAGQAGALGATLNQLFQRSFSVAKQVRSATEIGQHSISMAAAAVRLASQLFEDLSRVRVLLIGAGEMVELTATHFAARQPAGLVIANRTLERAAKLAARFGGEVMRLAELPERLHEFDIVVSSTAATVPIIGLGAVERALKRRRHLPFFMVDLAVPRDIEPEVKALDDVYLYTVDDLATVVQRGQQGRAAAVAQAEAIIDAGVQSFCHWLAQRDPAHGVVPLILRLQAQSEAWRSAELERARKQLARGDSPDAALDALARGLAQKMLHGVMAELHTGDAQARERASLAAEHFFLRKER